jgi:hypothetical protein
MWQEFDKIVDANFLRYMESLWNPFQQ